MNHFEQTLLGLNEPNDAIRHQAEAAFKEISHQPDQVIPLFVKTLNTSQDERVRETAAVLFRRACFSSLEDTSKAIWPDATKIVQLQARMELLSCILREPVHKIRRKVCDLVCEISRKCEEDMEAWPELLECLFQLTKSTESKDRQSAFYIFSTHPHVLGEQLSRYIGVIHELIKTSLVQGPDVEVRVTALQACISLTNASVKPSERQIFTDCIPPMLELVGECVSSPNDAYQEHGVQALTCLVDVADMIPVFLRPHLAIVVQSMVAVASNENYNENARKLAIELITTLCEKRPAMIRKFEGFPQLVLPVAFGMMLEIEDDDTWTSEDDTDDDFEETISLIGEQVLDRIARALGGKTILPFAFQSIMAMLQNNAWQQRHAALMTISAIAEGCVKLMAPELEKIVAMVAAYMKDPHERVRHATCNALGQMSTDFARDFQEKFHATVIPALLIGMSDTNPRVQAHAAAALVNFSEMAEKALLEPYLDELFTKLYNLLSSDRRIVQEQAITTIATLADSSESMFVKYYDTFMPMLIRVLENATDTKHRMLRGKTIECVTLIGLAVGSDKFMKDAHRVMEIMMQTPAESMAPDDPQVSFMMAAWARMCRVLGPEFIPYLPVVMPLLMHNAQLSPDLAILDPEDPDAEAAYDPADGWEFVSVDSQKIGIKTSTLEDKFTAVELIGTYAAELKSGFSEYVPQVTKVMVQSLKFLFHDGVRMAAAQSLPSLLVCVVEGRFPAAHIKEMWKYMLKELCPAIETEADPEMVYEFLSGLEKCVKVVGDNCMDTEDMSMLSNVVVSQLNQMLERAEERSELRKDQDFDEEAAEELGDEDMADEAVLKEISELMHTLFVTHRTNLLPMWASLCPTLARFLEPIRPASDRQWTLCVFDDLIEFAGPDSWSYNQFFVPMLAHSISDPNAHVRHAAVYGVGVAAQCGGPAYVPTVISCIEPMCNIINMADAKSIDNVHSTENAISAIAKICNAHGDKVPNMANVISQFLSWLPVSQDKEESVFVYGYLCTLLEQNSPYILGQNNSNMPRIVNILAMILNSDLVSGQEDLNGRVGVLLKTIANQFPRALSSISPEFQAKVQQLLQ
eukprot:CFRG2765T1